MCKTPGVKAPASARIYGALLAREPNVRVADGWMQAVDVWVELYVSDGDSSTCQSL